MINTNTAYAYNSISNSNINNKHKASLLTAHQLQQQQQHQQLQQKLHKQQQQKQFATGASKTDDNNLFPLESEQISKLFPKCRPKASDVNLNPVHETQREREREVVTTTTNNTAASNSSSTTITNTTTPAAVVTNKVGTSAMSNNKGNNMTTDNNQLKHHQQQQQQPPPHHRSQYQQQQYAYHQQYHQQQQERQQNAYASLYKDIDESLRNIRTRTPNTTPASTVLNSPDLSDLELKHHYQMGHHLYHNQIKVGRSPVEGSTDNILENYNSPSPTSPTMSTNNLVTSASMSQINNVNNSVGSGMGGGNSGMNNRENNTLMTDSEIVVFDDIGSSGNNGGGGGGGDTWSNRNLSSPIISDNEIRQMKQRYLKESYSMDESTGSSLAAVVNANNKPSTTTNERDTKTQKVIGKFCVSSLYYRTILWTGNSTIPHSILIQQNFNKIEWIQILYLIPKREIL